MFGLRINGHILHFRPLDSQMVVSSSMFTNYVSGWASDLRALRLNVGETTFGPPCIFATLSNFLYQRVGSSFQIS